jgi:nitrogen fixation protein NifX
MSSTIKVISNTELENSIKIAFATNDNENIDAHFGSAKQFHVYTINADTHEILSIINIEEKNMDHTISLLEGIDIVYFIDIGATAAAKIINRGIFPIKYKEEVSISSELEKLKEMINTNPAPFIKKILNKKAA